MFILNNISLVTQHIQSLEQYTALMQYDIAFTVTLKLPVVAKAMLL